MYAYEHAFSEEEVRAWLEKQQNNYRQYGFGLWAAVEKTSGRMIGQCGLTMQKIRDLEALEIGYLFRKDAWHQGYATEAAMACKAYAFEDIAGRAGLFDHSGHQPGLSACGAAQWHDSGGLLCKTLLWH